MCRLQTHHFPQRVSDPHPEHHNTINVVASSRVDRVETGERAQWLREKDSRAWNDNRHSQRTKKVVANGEGRREGSEGTVGKQAHPKLSVSEHSTTPSVSSVAANDLHFSEPSRPLHHPTGNEELDSDRRVLEQSAARRGSTVGDSGKTEPSAQLMSPPRLKEPANGDGSASRQNPLVHESSGDGRVLSEREVVSEEETKEDVSVSSLNHSSSELGTPSTSTPLRPPLPPPPSGGRTQDTLPPPLLPPFSSSLSVIAAEAPMSTTEDASQWETGGGGGFVMMGGGVEGDGDSVSVTVTELSEEDDGDTMFEETLPTESTLSGRTLATPTTPTQPSVRLISEEDEEESPLVSPSLTSGVSPSVTSLEEEEEGPLATPRPSHRELPTVPQVREDVDVMSVCIERLSLEPASSLTARVADISGYFVEFQVLDYDYGDLETPSVPVSPHSTHPVFFNFKKEFHVGPSQKALLTSALSSSTDNPDRKVLFTVVSDPVDQERECEEVGTAELDLSIIHQTGNDIVNQQLQVLSCNEDTELLGLLTVSVSAAHILRYL
jgi:hypothetical protein